MTLTNIAKRRRTCRNKTAKGNRYPNEWTAKAAAKSMNRVHETTVAPFACEVCGGWHIGKPAK